MDVLVSLSLPLSLSLSLSQGSSWLSGEQFECSLLHNITGIPLERMCGSLTRQVASKCHVNGSHSGASAGVLPSGHL